MAIKGIIAGVALAVAPVAAQAEEVTRWFGPYAGLALSSTGFGVSTSDTNSDEAIANATGGLGAFAGYNLQFRNTVWGVEADIFTGGQEVDLETADDPTTITSNYFGTLRARIGYAFYGNTLLSVSIGPAVLSDEVKIRTSTGSKTIDEQEFGLALGLTLEHKFEGSDWFIRGDLRSASGFTAAAEDYNIGGTTGRLDARDYSAASLSLGLGVVF
ncbi:MAG: outer membrane beta-barrel protein [Pseudomonadota bacterium]